MCGAGRRARDLLDPRHKQRQVDKHLVKTAIIQVPLLARIAVSKRPESQHAEIALTAIFGSAAPAAGDLRRAGLQAIARSRI